MPSRRQGTRPMSEWLTSDWRCCCVGIQGQSRRYARVCTYRAHSARVRDGPAMAHRYRTRFVVSARLRVDLATFHSRTVPSVLPVARVVPSGLNATEVTGPVCPVRGGPARG